MTPIEVWLSNVCLSMLEGMIRWIRSGMDELDDVGHGDGCECESCGEIRRAREEEARAW